MSLLELWSRMERYANRLASRYSQETHPLLGHSDLVNEAVVALTVVWNQLHEEKEMLDLCKIGAVAMLQQIKVVVEHSYSRGAGKAVILNLDQPINEEGMRLADVIGQVGIEDSFFWFALDELERSLDEVEKKVLWELLDPGVATLKAVRRLWEMSKGKAGNWWLRYRKEALSEGLGLPIAVVDSALKKVRAETKKIFTQEPCSSVYLNTKGTGHTNNKGRSKMGGSTGFIPDDVAMGLPTADQLPVVLPAEGAAVSPPAEPAVVVPAAAEVKEEVVSPEAQAAVAEPPAAAVAETAPATPAKRGRKKAVEAPPKEAKVEVPVPVFKKGDKVKFNGGRTSKIVEGAVGEVTAVYYLVKFENSTVEVSPKVLSAV